MKKYTYAFKARVVREYQSGEVSYEDLAKKHHIASPSLIERWVNKVDSVGFTALHNPGFIRYPVDFKYEVVDYYLNNNLSQAAVARHFNVDDPSVKHWLDLYKSDGLDSPWPKHKRGQSSMKKQSKPTTKEARQLQEIKNLKDELYQVKMERDVLKKLRAVTQKNHPTRIKRK